MSIAAPVSLYPLRQASVVWGKKGVLFAARQEAFCQADVLVVMSANRHSRTAINRPLRTRTAINRLLRICRGGVMAVRSRNACPEPEEA